MTLLLELNDLSVRCYRDGELLHQSPGIAIAEKNVVLGEQAWQQSRLHPQHTHSEFWSKLNTVALHSPNPKVRHHGDLAYLHLLHIQSQLPFNFDDQNVIYSLPSSMDRESLGLLLGISQQCGLNTVGLVDHALASMRPYGQDSEFFHLEMHMNYSVLTRLMRLDNQLQRQQISLLKDQGWLQAHAKILQFLSDQFIQKTRFNPRHDAESEQQLFNTIPVWIQQALSQPRIHCEIQGHQIDVDSHSLKAALRSALPQVCETLANLQNLYLGDRLSRWLPMFSHSGSVESLSKSQQCAAMASLSHHLDTHPEGVRLITSLPCDEISSPTATQANSTLATHILWRHQAYPLSGLYSLSADGDMTAGESASAILNIQQGKIRTTQSSVSLNQRPLENPPLRTGDQIRIDGFSEPLTLIEVTR
ncbi:MAG: hypothetical protein ACRBBW_00660 [Cellvibrionaceae bacterium]